MTAEEVHLFNASAVPTSVCKGEYRSGDRHAVLVFLRQGAGTDHDWDAAEGNLNSSGWTQVKFNQASTLGADDLAGSADYLLGAYEEAAQNGFGFIVYAKPMSGDDA
jgi:hypothetical protein